MQNNRKRSDVRSKNYEFRSPAIECLRSCAAVETLANTNHVTECSVLTLVGSLSQLPIV